MTSTERNRNLRARQKAEIAELRAALRDALRLADHGFRAAWQDVIARAEAAEKSEQASK